MRKWLLTLLVIFTFAIISGCNTRVQSSITKAEIKEMFEDSNRVDLYTATSLAQLSLNEVELKILVLQSLQQLDTTVDYTEQVNILKRQRATREEYLRLLYERVYN